MFALTVVALLALWTTSAFGHSQSSSQLSLDLSQSSQPSMTLDIALIDLSQAVDLDLNGDLSVTWGELQASEEVIARFVSDGVRIWQGDSRCQLATSARHFSMIERSDIPHLRLPLNAICPAGLRTDTYVLGYRLFFDINPAHRALVRVPGPTGESTHIFSPADQELRLGRENRPGSSMLTLARAGVQHILSGYDHLVFLGLLILPAAGRGLFRQKLLRIGLIVTAFTVAHSITLAVSVSGLVHLPARPVEIGIAASIVFAAVVNVARPAHRLGWQVAFCFGLLHGFGFAGALQELGVTAETLLTSLLAFNLGVEAGQLLVVALILPVLMLLSASAHYRAVLVPAISLAGAALGVAWTAARL